MNIANLKNCWDKASKLAVLHREETTLFNSLCEEYYGKQWDSIEQIVDNDDIINTLDYGMADLSFEDFHILMLKTLKSTKEMAEMSSTKR